MKKLMNRAEDYADEAVEGLCLAHPEVYRRVRDTGRVVARACPGFEGKVGIVSGGGSGHLPLFTGYVGQGLLDSCAIGNVFAGPTVDDVMAAMRAADHGAGVLCLYGNYGGDRMNFDMAGEFLKEEGLRSATVLAADDVASASSAESDKRRGVAGIVYSYKIAGAVAERRGSTLEDVTAAARKAVSACRTIGVALTPCTVPEVGTPTFVIGDGDVEMGMGIHGEPGVWRGPLRSADQLGAEMLERLIDDMKLGGGEHVSVMVNSLGATPYEELYILYRVVVSELAARNVRIVLPRIGRYATSMEMAGASLTLFHLDDEFERLLREPVVCPFWNN